MHSLIYNPNWVGRLLQLFISGAVNTSTRGLKVELIYLALPFLYEEPIREKLAKSTKRSTFQTVFQDANMKNCLLSMDSKVVEFESVTNEAFLMIGKYVSITDDGYIELRKILNYTNAQHEIKSYYKSAYNLGVILSKEDHREIFYKIGISE